MNIVDWLESLSSLGYPLAALGYFTIWLLLQTVRTNTSARHLLSIYLLLGVLWGISNSLNSAPFASWFTIFCELALSLSQVLFLLAVLGDPSQSLRGQLTQRRAIYLQLATGGWLMTLWLFPMFAGYQYLVSLLYSLLSLALLETLYRKSTKNQWQYKHLVIAFGVCLLLDFYLYAEGALLNQIQVNSWESRGWLHFLTLPLLLIGVKRIKAWSINVYISRDVVLQSSLLLISGIYLICLALAGYYIQYIGGNWTSMLQLVFGGLGLTLLAAVLFSTELRRRFRVFIEKNFFANTFDYRVKWVELTRQLAQVQLDATNAPQVCLQAMCKAIGYSHGQLWQRQAGKLVCLAEQGKISPLPELDVLLSAYEGKTAGKNWLLDFSDYRDLLVQQLRPLLTDGQAGFSILIPVWQRQQIWGYFLLRPETNEQLKLNWELRDYLNAVTEQISSYLFMAEASKQLSENAQFAAFSRMSAFVVHDLKNVKAQLDMLLKNAQKHRHNPEFIDDAFLTMESMQSRLQNMLGQLTNKQVSVEPSRTVNLEQLVQHVLKERCHQHLPQPELRTATPCTLDADYERLSNVLYHLIDNAQQATPETGAVWLEITQEQQFAVLKIHDTGCGMTEDFIKHRLFKPFDTTKGNAGMGIGAFDALNYAQSLGGSLEVQSQLEKGSTFTMRLPLQSKK